MSDLFPPSRAEMAAEMRREIAMRRRVYGRQVNTGKMRRDVAERRIAIAETILALIEAEGELSE